MLITDVQATALAIPLKPSTPQSSWTEAVRKQVIVRVFTDEDVAGTGEAFAYGAPLAVTSVIRESLAPLLVGQDPRHIDELVDRMHRATMIYGRRGLGMFAISGVEIALWDLLGRLRGAPIHQLLGGAVRNRIPAYASLMRYDSPEDVAAACRQAIDQGFRTLKLHQTDLASVAAARESVGPDVRLMLDVNCAWNPAEAIAAAHSFAPYRLTWLEEPVWPPEDYEGLARVAAAAGIAIALGENESTLVGFREIVGHHACSVLQPSVTKVGGISETMKIAALARAENLTVAPHSFYFGPGLAATAHIVAVLGGDVPIEIAIGELEIPLVIEPVAADDGWVVVPDGPGLGVSVNAQALTDYPYVADAAEPFVIAAR